MFCKSNHKPIARYYPEWLTKLLITYLYYVVPFREVLDPNFVKNPYLFSTRALGHWSVRNQTAALEKHSKRYLNFRLNTERWRQIQTAIDIYFIHTGSTYFDDNEEQDLISDLQATHSTRTAKSHYGRTEHGLDVRSRRDFNHNSNLWADWYGLTKRLPESEYAPVDTNNAASEPVENRVSSAMTRLYGSDWTWKSQGQHDSVMATVSKNEPFVLSVLPTDSGKTTMILVSALLDPHLTQVVVTPYVALADDLTQKCHSLHIDCLKWTLGNRNRATIVVVVVDTATTEEFTTYLRDLDLQSKLGRIFMDEAHVYFTETDWRWGITKIFDLCLPIQFAFISATLPPSMEKGLADLFKISRSVV
jgi:hypothetical protein